MEPEIGDLIKIVGFGERAASVIDSNEFEDQIWYKYEIDIKGSISTGDITGDLIKEILNKDDNPEYFL